MLYNDIYIHDLPIHFYLLRLHMCNDTPRLTNVCNHFTIQHQGPRSVIQRVRHGSESSSHRGHAPVEEF